MAPIGTLWTVNYQSAAKYVKSICALGGLEIVIPADYVHFSDNKTPEFLAKFPHGKIPAFENEHGFRLFEGIAIGRYVAGLAPNAGLLGGTPEEAALIDQWIHLAESEVDTFNNFIRGLCSGRFAYSKPIHNSLLERLIRALKTLENHISTRTFFVGERITLADLYIAAIIQHAAAATFDAPLRAQLPNLVRHLETIVKQPKLAGIYGEIPYVEKAIQFTPPVKEKKEKEAQPAPAPKAEKKPKAKDVDEEEDDLVPAEPKGKNPLDDLPKSTFNLEDWKRVYSNKDTRGAGGSFEWLYEKAKESAAAAEAERQKRKDAAAAAARASSPPTQPHAREPPVPTASSSKVSGNTARPVPDPEKTRVWHDRSGQFRVEAAFLGFNNGKLRLHKVNGVIVEVPSENMSVEDMRYVARTLDKGNRSTSAPRVSDDDVPLALSKATSANAHLNAPSPKKAPKIDLLDFFLSAGCEMDDCTRYAASFERDKIDETILGDITDGTMRSLGMREGDIIRVSKAIEKRKPTDDLMTPSVHVLEQLRRDEELARRL